MQNLAQQNTASISPKSQDIYGVIYLTTNHLNGKQYVGQTIKKGRDLEQYLGSGVALGRAFKKYGADNFTKEVLKECYTEEELNEAEIAFIKEHKTMRPFGYNIAEGGYKNPMKYMSAVEKQKFSIAVSEWSKAYYADPANRKANSERLKISHGTPEARKAQSERTKAQFADPEARKAMSESQKKRYADNPENRKAASERLKAFWADPEARKAMSEIKKAYYARKANKALY